MESYLKLKIETEFWSVFSHIRTEYEEILRTRETPDTDSFHAVNRISNIKLFLPVKLFSSKDSQENNYARV